MEQVFIKTININNVRHLHNLKIQVSDNKCKHIIFTGKNGSGKTSVLDSIAVFLDSITKGGSSNPEKIVENIDETKNNIDFLKRNEKQNESTILESENNLQYFNNLYKECTAGIWLELNKTYVELNKLFKNGKFIVAYYKADRVFKSVEPEHVEKVTLKDGYYINEMPRNEFIKYLLDMKMTQALAATSGKTDKAESISRWFEKFDDLLKKIFDDKSVRLDFDEETFKFSIVMDGREPFDFNTLSSGYAAILDIVVDLIIRMEKQSERTFDFNIPGIVLIDEIESHLHLELQKNIMKLLTTIFPNVQFIVSTHSPFILNCLDDVVIYDLEKNLFIQDGLSDIPYSGIVEGYFNSDELSHELRDKFEEYKRLADKSALDENDYEKIADLEMYLNEIPDYLALNLTTEYQELKAKIRAKEG